jgi:hypothetical protein
MPTPSDEIWKAVRICGRAQKMVETYRQYEPFIRQYMEKHNLTQMRMAGYEVQQENRAISFMAYDPEEKQMLFDCMEPIDCSKLQQELF